jgi:hypothetical protein
MRVLLGVMVLATLSFAHLAAAGECSRTCGGARKSCLRQAKADRSAMQADCTDLGGGRTCIKTATTRARTLTNSCRASFGQCRSCCRGGGTAVACSGGCEGRPLKSTWDGIQQIFQVHGCTQQACHGSARQGGLELSKDVAYRNLIEVHATAADMPRVQPGDERRSFLFAKLAAATDPSLVPPEVTPGTPMPNGAAAPLNASELEAIRKWIYAGAPEAGTVAGTDELLAACLPAPKPIRIRPLVAPPSGQGFQLRMPVFRLPAHSEMESCFATYYDLTGVVPKEYQDAAGTVFLWHGQELRQDPQSHHLILNRYFGNEDPHDPAFGAWMCAGGDRNGAACEPLDPAACGKDGSCVAYGGPHCQGGPRNGRNCDPATADACGEGGSCVNGPRSSFACIGFGPTGSGRAAVSIGGAQKAQSFQQFPDGVYAAIPLKGILFWNPHAFNLSDLDTVMHGWINYYYTKDTRWFVRSIFNVAKIFAANAAPFTKQMLCNTHELPQNAHLYSLSSHTHRHGDYFWIEGPDGAKLYENFVYNDPPNLRFAPPLVFDSPDPAQRTLKYCAIFNNGLKADGSPDTELVTRASRVPPNAPAFSRCRPRACVAGTVTAPCVTNADCDSAAGAGDGLCDACAITGGESTENEMFILIGQYYVP